MRAYGEIEFWFALIKLVAIVRLIVTGVITTFHVGELGTTASVTNLWTHAKSFGTLGGQQVPLAGIHASAAVMLVRVVLNYAVPFWFALLGVGYWMSQSRSSS